MSLLDRFQQAYPVIQYQIVWRTNLVNAQAWRLGRMRYVTLYGGLAKHKSLSEAGIALTLAHETGHHMGGLPRDPDMPWQTWQGQADYWAASVAMPRIFGDSARTMTQRGATEIQNLEDLMVNSDVADAQDYPSACRYLIFEAGASGRPIPRCAIDALEEILSDS